MALLTRWSTAVALAALVSGSALPAQQAHAQTLFETLFGGGLKKTKQSDFPTRPPAARKAVPATRISAPAYYTYKADPLVRVNFAAIATPSAEPVAFDPSAARSAFKDALPGLEGYELLAESRIAKALVVYYAATPGFIWVENGAPNARAAEAVRVLGGADSFGLEPADYAVGIPGKSDGAETDMVRFEMALSARVLRYVGDATNGRIDPNRISGYHDLPPKTLDLKGVLDTLAHTAEAKTYLESRHPQNAQYQALRVELEALKASTENEIVVDPRLLLKPGETSPELPKLLQLIARDLNDEMGGEHGETLWRLASSQVYEKDLVPVIQAAQKRAGLTADGVVGPRTVAAVAGTSKAERLEKVNIALEQLRWLPSDLGSPRVFVNGPAFVASYIEGEVEKLSMRVVIGRPSTQTSFFYDEIEQVDYNPYWGVPQSIIVNEMLPRLHSDPGYLDRAGYEVTDAKGKRIPSAAINWGAYGSKVPYNVRQIPSEDNALGELKILFPNKHAIYMHDTPSKNLFERDSRAFSHGCIRLQRPRDMAAAVLGTSVDYVATKIGQGHSSEKLAKKVPVYIAYFTAWPNMDGKVAYFADIYDRDSRVKAAIEKTEDIRSPSS